MTFISRKKISSLIASVLIVASTSFAVITPVQAGGAFSISIAPQNAEDEQAMRAGLAVYSIFNALNGSGGIRQKGHNNSAGLNQNGSGNFGVVHQEGNGHSGTLQQNGRNNAHGLFQFGRNTNANVVQSGRGNTGATFLFGWE